MHTDIRKDMSKYVLERDHEHVQTNGSMECCPCKYVNVAGVHEC